MQGALSRLDGVIKAEVDFDQKLARVQYDPGKTNPQAITQGLEKETQGRYKATVQ